MRDKNLSEDGKRILGPDTEQSDGCIVGCIGISLIFLSGCALLAAGLKFIKWIWSL